MSVAARSHKRLLGSAARFHPSTSPHDRHIRSSTRSFSARPSAGSSRSTTSSKKPSRRREFAGRYVSAYVLRWLTESRSSPEVSGGIEGVGCPREPPGVTRCDLGCAMRRRSMRLRGILEVEEKSNNTVQPTSFSARHLLCGDCHHIGHGLSRRSRYSISSS